MSFATPQRAYANLPRLTDAFAIVLAVTCALSLTRLVAGEVSAVDVIALGTATVAWVTALEATRAHSDVVDTLKTGEISQALRVTAGTFGAMALVVLAVGLPVSRVVVVAPAALGTLLVGIGRWWCMRRARSARAQGRGLISTIVVGGQESARETVRRLQAHGSYRVRGVVLAQGTPGPEGLGVPALGAAEDTVTVAAAHGVDLVILAPGSGLTSDQLNRVVWDLHARQIEAAVTTNLANVPCSRLDSLSAGGTDLRRVRPAQVEGASLCVKRILDCVAAALGLVLLSPVLLIVASLVKMSSPGPVLFRQERIGRNGRSFELLKFRSMRQGAEAELEDVLGSQIGIFYKIKKDPRVTRIGNRLRRTSLDELPQLVNILRGDMSLVGPRPQIKKEVEQYDDLAARRLIVRPGLTGLWQVSGRSRLEPADGIRADLTYVENWSLWYDAAILLRTPRAVLYGDGAY